LDDICSEITVKVNNRKKKITDIKNNDTVKKIIIDFMKKKYQYDESVQKQVSDKVVDIVEQIKYNYDNQGKKFKLKSLEFDNFFNYREGNRIDFTKMKGITGLKAPSFSGKSAVIDAILYAIYGTATRGDKVDTVNISKKHMKTRIVFSLNDDEFVVERERRLKNRSKRDSSEIVKIFKNGANISEKDTDSTNQRIRELVCDSDELENVCIMLQKNCINFIDLKGKDRKDRLCKLLKLDIFNDILTETRSQIRRNVIELNAIYKKTSKKADDKDIGDNLKKYREELDVLVNKLSEKNSEYGKLYAINEETRTRAIEYVVRLKEYGKLKSDSFKITTLSSGIKKLEKEISDEQQETERIRKQYKESTKKISDLSDRLIDFGDIEKRYIEYLTDKEVRIRQLEDQYNKCLMEKLPENRSNLNITLIKSAIKKYEKEINDISLKINTNEIDINKLQSDIVVVKKVKNLEENYTKYVNYLAEMEKLNNRHNQLKETLSELEQKSVDLEAHQYNPECQACLNNPVTREKIKCREQIDENKRNQEELEDLIHQTRTNVDKFKKYEKMYKSFLEKTEKNNKCRAEIEKLEAVNQLLRKDLQITNQELSSKRRETEQYEEYLTNKKKNAEIDVKCSEIKNQISDIRNEKLTEYEKYTELKKQKEQMETVNKKIENMIKENDNSINSKSNELEKNRIELDKYNETKTKIQEIGAMTKKYEEVKAKESGEKAMLSAIENDIKQIEKSKTETEIKIKKEEDNIQEYKSKQDEMSVLKILEQILDKDGLVDNLLSENVLPTLEESINSILSYIADYQVEIGYEKGSIKIEKISKSDKTRINIDTLSGCEDFIANLCFRLALTQYNNYIKTPFFIIDESFKYCDENFISKLPNLFEYMKKYFDWVIVISHDDKIIKLYDKTIKIDVSKEGSHILFE